MVMDGADPPGLIRDPDVNQVDPVLLKRNGDPFSQAIGALAEVNGSLTVVAR
jgi:hypothetical protein